MAKAHQDLRLRDGNPGAGRRGRDTLAEVVPIRPEVGRSGPGLGPTLSRIVQVFASLRAQAASVESPPCPPSPPAPRRTTASTGPVAPDAA